MKNSFTHYYWSVSDWGSGWSSIVGGFRGSKMWSKMKQSYQGTNQI